MDDQGRNGAPGAVAVAAQPDAPLCRTVLLSREAEEADLQVQLQVDHAFVLVTRDFFPYKTDPDQAGVVLANNTALAAVVLGRCSFPSSEDFSSVSLCEIRGYTGTFYTRVLSVYIAAGLATVAYKTEAEFMEALARLPLPTSAELQVRAADIALGQSFDAEAAEPARAAQTRRQAAAPPLAAAEATPGPEVLRWLHAVDVRTLEDADAPSPLAALATLHGLLGPVGSRAARRPPSCAAQQAAQILRPRVIEYALGGAAATASDTAVAAMLGEFLRSLSLPTALKGSTLTPTSARIELLDAIKLNSSNQREADQVVDRRLIRLTR